MKVFPCPICSGMLLPTCTVLAPSKICLGMKVCNYQLATPGECCFLPLSVLVCCRIPSPWLPAQPLTHPSPFFFFWDTDFHKFSLFVLDSHSCSKQPTSGWGDSLISVSCQLLKVSRLTKGGGFLISLQYFSWASYTRQANYKLDGENYATSYVGVFLVFFYSFISHWQILFFQLFFPL